ncbi:hypothetical protein B0T26DRAFT_807794 [Lasiosphaeria miniovina]|uniref:AMP-dependent synthetase/ligase domain-containing protein n=1 Tax=Lasiosphaeria miniovina TaxID=1954250 RepID=A0AA39ZQW1_9PEZI|nr:uncharacterized protein B0T26DRAFT_807794 [Lasiosphaeria miniovina]KAK0701966.1 hypothetical protein B0T26DRAFT_807794 [Lasiosphaeria miniovina]
MGLLEISVSGRLVVGETIGYMGAHDIRYHTINISPHSAVEGQLHLLETTSCTKLFYTAERVEKVGVVRSAIKPGGTLNTLLVPAYAEFLSSPRAVTPFPSPPPPLPNRPALIFHTSGSTGHPKPVPITHGYLAALDCAAHLPVPPGRTMAFSGLPAGTRLLVGLPLFHLGGAACSLFLALFHGYASVLHPPAAAPNDVQPFLDALDSRDADVNAVMLPPSALEGLVRRGALARLARLERVLTGSGTMAPATGDALVARGVKMIHVYGSTEAGLVPSLVHPDPQLWPWFEWNERYGAVMELVDNNADGVYELVFRSEPQHVPHHPVFHAVPATSVWRSRDLFARHPSEPRLWQFIGRTDDVVVLSTGEKVNPVAMQDALPAHPLLKGALVVGQGRFRAALLVETDWSKWNGTADGLVDEIWPAVQAANPKAESNGRVARDKIAVVLRGRAFKRADKGSVQRLLTSNKAH